LILSTVTRIVTWRIHTNILPLGETTVTEEPMNEELLRIIGNVARGNDPRDPPQPTNKSKADLWFPWLVWVRAGLPLALFLLFVLIA